MTTGTRYLDYGIVFDAQAAAAKLVKARADLEEATAEAKHAAQVMVEHGATEDHIARRLGVTRRTVRRWLGRSAP